MIRQITSVGFAVFALSVLIIATGCDLPRPATENLSASLSESIPETTTGYIRPTEERGEVLSISDYRLSGPYLHQNLAIFLVHGRETMYGVPFLTLQDAYEQGKVSLHSIATSTNIIIENRS